MKYDILTNSDYFQAVLLEDEKKACENYEAFIATVIDVSRKCDTITAYTTLTYTMVEMKPLVHLYKVMEPQLERVMEFIREMRDMVETMAVKGIKVGTAQTDTSDIPPLEWTGQTVDLIELVYALRETGSVNNGEIPIGKMNDAIFRLFGHKTLKDYARFYVSIKDREDDYSRTYFLDKMRRKLNEKIKADIKKSLSR